MTNYQVFLCIMGVLTVTVVALSVRTSFRTRSTHIGDPPFSNRVRESSNPILFWTYVIAQILAAVVVLAAVLIAVFRH